MIRVVLDANVFVSAVLKSTGNPAQILELVQEGRITLLVSPDILAEVRATLLYPKLRKLHQHSARWIKGFLQELSAKAELTPGELVIDAIKADPSDTIYLVCAVEGSADFVVSGDHHLKELKTFRGIRIVDPSTFMELIKQE
ncbi:MAG: putative toxin-antitoxin system toxin component, PIN family [Syntrophobacteraceae bacterium]